MPSSVAEGWREWIEAVELGLCVANDFDQEEAKKHKGRADCIQ